MPILFTHHPASTATIKIQDNDLPYGILSFSPSSRNVAVSEDDGSVTLEVQRTDGALSTATVEIVTLGGKDLSLVNI